MPTNLGSLYPSTKPWIGVAVPKGSTFTVPANASLVTVTGVAAGGMSDAAAYSVLATSATHNSAEILTDELFYVGSGNPGVGNVIQSELNAVRQTPGLVGAFAANYGCAAKASYLGQWWMLEAGSYNSNASNTLSSSVDMFATINSTAAVGAGKIAEIMTDTTGASPMVATCAADTNKTCTIYADPTLGTALFTTTTSGSITTMSGGRMLNGTAFAFGADASAHPEVVWSNGTAAFAGVQLNSNDASTISDMAYSPTIGGGTYVAVGSGGKIYSTTTPGTAPWTSRTSGVATALTGVIWANGAFIAVGASGVILRSTDAITWTAATGCGSANFARRSIIWNAFANVFAVADNSTGIFYTSPTGATWTAGGTLGGAVQQLLFTQCGKPGKGTYWVMFLSAAPYYSTSAGASWSALSSITPGRSDLVVAVNGVERLRLRGGGNGTSTAGGNGASYRFPEIAGSTVAGAPGSGPAGSGGYPAAADSGNQVIPSQFGGKATWNATGTVPAGGGGGVYPYWDYPSTTTGIFVSGASGAMINSGASADWPGGGGSIFCNGQNASVNASPDNTRAPGRGSQGLRQSATNYGAGGGGEGCIRVPITCSAGDVLEAWGGLGSVTTVNTTGPFAGDGCVLIEYQL